MNTGTLRPESGSDEKSFEFAQPGITNQAGFRHKQLAAGS
jgi:hypothetical protein